MLNRILYLQYERYKLFTPFDSESLLIFWTDSNISKIHGTRFSVEEWVSGLVKGYVVLLYVVIPFLLGILT